MLRHALSREEKLLKHGATLHFAGPLGFVKQGKEVTWVNSILSWSLWKTEDGGEFCFRKTGDSSYDAFWIKGPHKKSACLQSYLFPVTDPQEGVAQKTIKVFIFAQPRPCGSAVFWAIGDVLRHVGMQHTGKYVRDSISRSWAPVLARHNIGNDHVLYSHKTGKVGCDGVSLHTTAISTVALLCLLTHWTSQRRAEARQQAFTQVFNAVVGRIADGGGVRCTCGGPPLGRGRAQATHSPRRHCVIARCNCDCDRALLQSMVSPAQ